jgi:hypothetical protein
MAASITFCEPTTLVWTNSVHGPQQPWPVPDVADEEPQPRVVAEQLAHLPLLELVAAEHDDPARSQPVQGVADERLAEGPGASGDEDVGAGEDGHVE